MNAQRLHDHYRQAALAAQRRRALFVWLERYELLHRTPARTESEREAKIEALEAMKQCQPPP